MRAPTETKFLEMTNGKSGRAFARTFDGDTFATFRRGLRRARYAAKRGKPFYLELSGGGVANAYGYQAKTASCGIWVDPVTVEVVWFAGRVDCGGRYAPCPRTGGERQYMSDWRRVVRNRTIDPVRVLRDGGDASEVAARAARAHGTTLVGNIRWYGKIGPEYRAVSTADGRMVQVFERL